MLDRKKFLIVFILIGLITIKLHADCPPEWPDCEGEPATVPIPGILYFLLALLGVGIKKLYNGRKKDH